MSKTTANRQHLMQSKHTTTILKLYIRETTSSKLRMQSVRLTLFQYRYLVESVAQPLGDGWRHVP